MAHILDDFTHPRILTLRESFRAISRLAALREILLVVVSIRKLNARTLQGRQHRYTLQLAERDERS